MEYGRRIRVTRTVSEEDLTQADVAFMFADNEDTASLPATTTASTTTTTTTVSAAGAVSAAAPPRGTAPARRARRASPIPPPALPASAREVTDVPSLLRVVFADNEDIASLPATTTATTFATTSTTTSTTTDSAAGAVSAAVPSKTAPARRARRASPPPALPALAREVTDVPSLLRVVTQLSAAIQKAVFDGKSVTAVNKRLISGAAEEIRRAANALAQASPPTPLEPQQPPTTTSTSATIDASGLSDVKKELVACVRAEITKLKAELAGARPVHPSPDAAAPTTTRSYAQVLGSRPARRPVPTPTQRVTKPAIIVTAKREAKTRQDAVTAFRKSISFKESGFAPAHVKPVSGNKLRVEFDTSGQRDDTLRRLQGSEQVSAELARNLQPLIIAKGIDNDTPAEELVNIIRGQNPALAKLSDDEFVLKFKRKNRNPKLYNAVFITKSNIFRIITGLGRVCIDHQRVHVEEFSPFLQCFRCLQFGHVKKNCSTQEEVCAFCAGSKHSEATCPARKLDGAVARCYNCANRNSKFESNTDTKHSATSYSCSVLRAMKSRVESRVDYGSAQQTESTPV